MSSIPDIWSYASGDPLYTMLLAVMLIIISITITVIVFRWYERSHEHAAETALLNQEVQDMIAHRMESLDYNRAIVRQINAVAATEEQLAVTMAVVNSILAGEGGVRIAETAKQLTSAVTNPNPTEEKKQ